MEEAPESWETWKSKTVSTCRREVVGGEILKLPFTGVMPAEPVTTPLLRARGMSFLDTNPLAAKVRPKQKKSLGDQKSDLAILFSAKKWSKLST